MRSVTLFSFLFTLLFYACGELPVADQSNDTPKKQVAPENLSWREAINSGNSLSNNYLPSAVKAFVSGEVITGAEEIAAHWKTQAPKVTSITSDTLIVARDHPLIEYEIGEFATATQWRKFLIIWETDSTGRKRSFEMDVAINEPGEVSSEVSNSRDRWVVLCNQHDASQLIREMYTTNTVYYNHRPVVQGQENLIKVYGYMNNPNYHLTLKPIISEPVSDRIVFEVGQCSGSYNGKYVIVWEKGDDGKWKVLMDANF